MFRPAPARGLSLIWSPDNNLFAMRTPYGISWLVLGLCLLLALDIGWRIWSWSHPHAICVTATSIRGQPFMVMADHRSNVDAISLRKAETWEPVWAEWDFDQDGRADTASYFLEGRNIFNVNLQKDRPPRFDVYFYGPGKSVIWWLDRGNGSAFTDRITYDAEGKQVRHEVLLGQTWRMVETRGQERGVMMDGKWMPLKPADDISNVQQPPMPVGFTPLTDKKSRE